MITLMYSGANLLEYSHSLVKGNGGEEVLVAFRRGNLSPRFRDNIERRLEFSTHAIQYKVKR